MNTRSHRHQAGHDQEQGRSIIEPVRRLAYGLEELVAGITDDNRHGEIGFGPPVDGEIIKP